MRGAAATLALMAFLFGATPAAAECRQALVLALDVSGSVDGGEYRLQLDGLAQALETPEVQEALFALPDAPVSLAIFEWSSGTYQRMIVGWTAIADPAALAGVTGQLRGWRRKPAPESTGIGAALQFAGGLLRDGPVCWRSTIDLSADGKNNDWPDPRDVIGSALVGDATINALVIGNEYLRRGQGMAEGILDLESYFKSNVIQGTGAFVEVAIGYRDYAEAMARKLLREVSSPPLGMDGPPVPHRFAGEPPAPLSVQ